MSTEPAGGAKPRRPPVDDGRLIVGLVGRAGSGKSSVARSLAGLGAVVLDADRIGHDVTARDPGVRAALIAEYGPEIYPAGGELDRRAVADKVFRDPAALARLNALVHPRILAELRKLLADLAAGGFQGVVIVDAALLLDWGFERECDAILAVTAPEPLQIARLVAARGWSEAQARERLAAQRPQAGFAAAADETIVNDGPETALAAAAGAALDRLVATRAAQRDGA